MTPSLPPAGAPVSQLDYWPTKLSGVQIVEIDAERNVRWVGVLWIDGGAL